MEDGVYTIYSTCTNKYTILRVNTPDPDEYYLIEIRLKEGFEQKLTSGDSKGGMIPASYRFSEVRLIRQAS